VKYGGNPNVVIAEPDVKCFKIMPEHDFVILGCKAFIIIYIK
jgi:protein phosphatase 2C family protein 2/3